MRMNQVMSCIQIWVFFSKKRFTLKTFLVWELPHQKSYRPSWIYSSLAWESLWQVLIVILKPFHKIDCYWGQIISNKYTLSFSNIFTKLIITGAKLFVTYALLLYWQSYIFMILIASDAKLSANDALQLFEKLYTKLIASGAILSVTYALLLFS